MHDHRAWIVKTIERAERDRDEAIRRLAERRQRLAEYDEENGLAEEQQPSESVVVDLALWRVARAAT